MKATTIAGLIPLFAIAVADRQALRGFKDFSFALPLVRREPAGPARSTWPTSDASGVHDRVRMALVDSHKLTRLLAHALDEDRLLSPYGVRSVSRRHAEHPFVLKLDGTAFTLDYEPAESTSGMFGGNSNWRGPVWFPLNFLLIEALQKHHYFLGDEFRVPDPAGTGESSTLWQVTSDLSQRLIALFLRDACGRRPAHGRYEKFQTDPHWKDLILFYEYFHGETGAGLGASHQTGWTGLVAKLIQQHAEYTLQQRSHEASGEFGSDDKKGAR